MQQPNTNSFLSSKSNKLMLILTLVLLVVSVTFVYLYKSTRNSLIEQTATSQNLVNQNKQLVIEMEERERINKIDKETIAGLEKALGSKQDQITDVQKAIDEKVASVKIRYEALPKTDANKIAMEREISAERIRGAWLLYCKQNPKHERCK